MPCGAGQNGCGIDQTQQVFPRDPGPMAVGANGGLPGVAGPDGCCACAGPGPGRRAQPRRTGRPVRRRTGRDASASSSRKKRSRAPTCWSGRVSMRSSIRPAGWGSSCAGSRATAATIRPSPAFASALAVARVRTGTTFTGIRGRMSWTYAALGALRHKVRPGSVEAWVWGDGTTLPAADLTFEVVCPSPTPTATPPATSTPQQAGLAGCDRNRCAEPGTDPGAAGRDASSRRQRPCLQGKSPAWKAGEAPSPIGCSAAWF